LLINFLYYSKTNGDGGKDILGTYGAYFLIVQCKNTVDKVRPKAIREMLGTMEKHLPEVMFGVFVTSRRDGYTQSAIDEATKSKYNLLLTNIHDIKQDIARYAFTKECPIQEIMKAIVEQDRKLTEQEERLKILNNLTRIVIVLVTIILLLVGFMVFVIYRK